MNPVISGRTNYRSVANGLTPAGRRGGGRRGRPARSGAGEAAGGGRFAEDLLWMLLNSSSCSIIETRRPIARQARAACEQAALVVETWSSVLTGRRAVGSLIGRRFIDNDFL
ncbi:MAG: hypothetical protein ACREHD_05050, partial [Pirellulales bacterium]